MGIEIKKERLFIPVCLNRESHPSGNRSSMKEFTIDFSKVKRFF